MVCFQVLNSSSLLYVCPLLDSLSHSFTAETFEIKNVPSELLLNTAAEK